MTAQEFLRQYSDFVERLEELDIDINIAESNMMKTTASYESDGGGSGDPLERRRTNEARLGDLIVRRANLSAEAERKRQEMFDVLEGIPDHKCKRVLQMHYCDMVPFKEIMETIQCCEKSVYNYHSRGIATLEKMLWR